MVVCGNMKSRKWAALFIFFLQYLCNALASHVSLVQLVVGKFIDICFLFL